MPPISDLLSRFGAYDFRQKWLITGYMAFILGFFFFDSGFHNQVFYFGLIAPFFLLMKKEFLVRFFSQNLIRLLVVYIAYFSISCIWSENGSLDLVFRYLKRGFYILTFIGATCLLSRIVDNFTGRLIRFMVILTGVYAAVAMVVWYSSHSFPDYRLVGMGRLANPINGTVAVIAFNLTLLLSYLSDRCRVSLLEFSMAVPALLYSILSQSRGPFVALAVIFFIQVIHYRNRKALLLSAAAAFAFLLWLAYDPGLIERFLFRGTSFRMEIWKDAVNQYLSCNPLLGCGLSRNPRFFEFNDTHSLYISSLYFGGIIGLFLYLALVFKVILDGWRREGRQSHWMWIFLFVSLSSLVVGNKILLSPNHLWVYFWLPVAAVTANRFQAAET